MRFMKKIFALCLLVLLTGCAVPKIAPTKHLVITWEAMSGWTTDNHAAAIPAFLRSCEKIREQNKWRHICAAAAALPKNVDDDTARLFFEKYFMPQQLLQKDNSEIGLVTGYYEPLLQGALQPSARYQYPIYARPDDLLTIELGVAYPSLQKRKLRGRLANGKIIPYHSRADINGESNPLAGHELLWVDDKVALFFLHIQGSGLVQLPNGDIIGVGYTDQNGHVYLSIGRLLAQRGDMELEDVNLFSIRQWLEQNPQRADELLHSNPSYIFFTRRDAVAEGPIGSLGVTLTPERSLAVDNEKITLGAPVWLDTVMPDDGKTPLQQLMMAQDTGGAINGDIRADVFWGRGTRAEKMAGLMKTHGRLYVLIPKADLNINKPE